jgi:hypothetical protein
MHASEQRLLTRASDHMHTSTLAQLPAECETAMSCCGGSVAAIHHARLPPLPVEAQVIPGVMYECAGSSQCYINS